MAYYIIKKEYCGWLVMKDQKNTLEVKLLMIQGKIHSLPVAPFLKTSLLQDIALAIAKRNNPEAELDILGVMTGKLLKRPTCQRGIALSLLRDLERLQQKLLPIVARKGKKKPDQKGKPDLTLPFAGSAAAAGPVFSINNTGTGKGGEFTGGDSSPGLVGFGGENSGCGLQGIGGPPDGNGVCGQGSGAGAGVEGIGGTPTLVPSLSVTGGPGVRGIGVDVTSGVLDAGVGGGEGVTAVGGSATTAAQGASANGGAAFSGVGGNAIATIGDITHAVAGAAFIGFGGEARTNGSFSVAISGDGVSALAGVAVTTGVNGATADAGDGGFFWAGDAFTTGNNNSEARGGIGVTGLGGDAVTSGIGSLARGGFGLRALGGSGESSGASSDATGGHGGVLSGGDAESSAANVAITAGNGITVAGGNILAAGPGSTITPGNGVVGQGGNDETGTVPGGHGIVGIPGTGSVPGLAGLFNGNVQVNGDFTATGAKAFKIDHPLEPEKKYLCHAAVESAELKNFYDGLAVLDEKGEAVVEMPPWFGALNEKFRYQLTPLGFIPHPLYIAAELENNRFRIAGGSPGLKVCWQVTGVRKDVYAQKSGFQVEVPKAPHEQGCYLSPDFYGEAPEKGLFASINSRSNPSREEIREEAKRKKRK